MTMQNYLDPTQEQGPSVLHAKHCWQRDHAELAAISATADYSAARALMPGAPISGEKAYRLYMEHTVPFLKASGGEVLFYGSGGDFLIGPPMSVGMRSCWSANQVLPLS